MNLRLNPKPKTPAKSATSAAGKQVVRREYVVESLVDPTKPRGNNQALLEAVRKAQAQIRGQALPTVKGQAHIPFHDPHAEHSPAAATAKLVTLRPKTMRLEPANEAGLALLKDAMGSPINKMVNEAVSEYVGRKAATLESNLTRALERVKAHRRADPTFANDLQAFVSDEAKHGAKDPLEGETYDVTPPLGKKAGVKTTKAAKRQSALAKVRGILRG